MRSVRRRRDNRLSAGQCGRGPRDFVEKPFAVGPVRGGDDHLRRDAVERAVVGDRRRQVLGLEVKLLFRIRSRHDNPGGDVAQLARDGLAEDRIVFALPPFALGPGRAPDDRVVRMDRTGDVHLVDKLVRDGGGPDLGSPVDDPQETRVDQRRISLLEDRPQRLVDRVHFQQDGPSLLKQLGEGIGRRDRRDVARSQHQGNPRVARIPASGDAVGTEPQRFLRDARLHPGIDFESLEGDPVEHSLGGKDGNAEAIVRPHFRPAGKLRPSEGGDLAEALNHQSQLANGRHRTGHDVLRPQRAALRDALVAAGRVDPVAGGLDRSLDALVGQLDQFPRRRLCEAVVTFGQRFQGAVDVTGRRAGRRCQCGRHGRLPETGEPETGENEIRPSS